MKVNKLSDWVKEVKKRVQHAMIDVAEIVKSIEQDMIEDLVYDVYEPYEYQRRGNSNGGLQDKSMMISPIKQVGNHIILSVINTAKGQNEEDLYLAPLIEYGHNNGYGEYQYRFNRDNSSWKYLTSRAFTQATIDALRRSGIHVKTLKNGLIKLGLNVK